MARMEDVIRRVGQCETEIKDLSIKLAENSVNMEYIREIINDFKGFMNDTREYMNTNTLTLKSVQFSMEALKSEVGEVKKQVEGNEESHKIDLRIIWKKVISKVLIGILVAAILVGATYFIATQ
jgi:hypothetical protein